MVFLLFLSLSYQLPKVEFLILTRLKADTSSLELRSLSPLDLWSLATERMQESEATERNLKPQILILFKVLVVLEATPVAAPFEAMLNKQAITKVAFLYLIAELFLAIYVWPASSGLYHRGTVFALLDIGIVQRVDVDGQSQCMF